MGGIVGRIFREFAVTLSITVIISLLVSLTTTPMMCSRLLVRQHGKKAAWPARFAEWVFDGIQGAYVRTLDVGLRHPKLVMLTLAAVIAFNVKLFIDVPKGFFPQSDTGRLNGMIQGDQSISFQEMEQKMRQFQAILQHDPAVAHVAGFTGGRQTNGGFFFVALKPLAERQISADQVIARLRPKLNHIAGARLFLQAVQDISVGGRQSAAQYQFTLQSNDTEELLQWAGKITTALQQSGELADVNSDQQQNGLAINLVIDRDTAARFGITPLAIDNTLYDAFGQRQVSTIYNALNQYHVIMEVAPQYWQDPQTLKDLYVSVAPPNASGTQTSNAPAGTTANSTNGESAPSALSVAADAARNAAINSIANIGHGGASSGSAVSTDVESMVPIGAFSRYEPGKTFLSVNHQGLFASTTISFNLKPGQALSDAMVVLDKTMQELGVPPTVKGSFSGTAATFVKSLATEPLLILAALVTVYIVLGILYESYVHPLTILSTLPSAGVGAVLALMICGKEFTIIALIGVILLIGIVKKNAILMVDFAIHAERGGMGPREAIRTACMLRFRPILMTTLAAALGALPLALGLGEGAETRQPLGIAIVGGLLASQLLTLYTTPVVYIYLDDFGAWLKRMRRERKAGSPQIRPA
jgi:multidrug efflux pump